MCTGCCVKPRRLWGRRGFTRQPKNSKRAHLRAPALQKHHQNSTRRHPERHKKNKIVAGEGKKAPNVGPSTFGAPPFGAPTLQGPTLRVPPFGVPPFGVPHFGAQFFWVWGLHPSGPQPFGAPQFGCLFFYAFFIFFFLLFFFLKKRQKD